MYFYSYFIAQGNDFSNKLKRSYNTLILSI